MYRGVHVTCFVFLAIPGANSHRSRSLFLVGHDIKEIDLSVKLSKFFLFPPRQLSELSWLGWKFNLSGQVSDNRDNRLKTWTREMSQEK